MRTLTDDDLEALVTLMAQRLPALQSKDPFYLFTRREAAAYCQLSQSTFERERRRVPNALKPVASQGPLATRWHRATLDIYKATGGAVMASHGRGRPKK